MSDEISARNISKFNGTNFQGWKFQVNMLFIAHGIRDVVDGTRIIPVGEAREEARKQWIKDNARAMFSISSSIEYEQLEALIVCGTAKEMWDKLSRIHEQKSASTKLLLTQKFHEYRMYPGDSIVHHIAKVQNMAAQLLDVGEPVSDMTIMAKVLASLSPKYATLQTAWDSVDPERQTLENLQERLIREEARLTLDDEVPGAFSAFKKKKNELSEKEKRKLRKPKDRKDVECFKCKEKGHFVRECKNKRRERKEREESDTRESRDCAFVAEKTKKKPGEVGIKEGSESSVDVINEVLNAGKEDAWITDSGGL